jgi:hypothetical protein
VKLRGRKDSQLRQSMCRNDAALFFKKESVDLMTGPARNDNSYINSLPGRNFDSFYKINIIMTHSKSEIKNKIVLILDLLFMI